MLQLILHLSKLFFREPCSVQREILNRLQKRRGAWDAGNDELLEIYEYVNTITKKRTGAPDKSWFKGESIEFVKSNS